MYYPPDIENLRNSSSDRYISVRDVIELHKFNDSNYKIPFVLGMDGDSLCAVDIAQNSPIFIGERGGMPHTQALWCFIALILLKRSPEQVKLVIIDSLGVDLKFAEKLPHTVAYAHESQEVLGVLMRLEDEIIERENKHAERVPIVVLASNIGAAYPIAPELYGEALKTLLERGRAVNVFALFAIGLGDSLFCRDFDIKGTNLPSKPVVEPCERDIVELAEEAVCRNLKSEDKAWKEKYDANVARAKALLEKYRAKKEKQSLSALMHFFDALKLLAEYKKLSASLVQRKLRIGYSMASKIIDSLSALSVIKESEGEGSYALIADEEAFLKIVEKL